jgi:hypothetical protein
LSLPAAVKGVECDAPSAVSREAFPCRRTASAAILAAGILFEINIGENHPTQDPRMKSFLVLTLQAAAAALVLSSCSLPTVSKGGGKSSFSFDPPAKKVTNPAAVRVMMSTSAQRLYVVEGNEVLLATPICVGTAAAPTPKGTFPIQAKVANRRRASSPGAGYPMTYWMQFYSPAYGMHWGFVKPHPATHGCVRLPLNSARKIYGMVRVGTKVNVATTQPWDSTIGKKLPVLDDSSLPNPPDSYLQSPKVFADAAKGKMWNF